MGNKPAKLHGVELMKQNTQSAKPLPTAKDLLLVHGFIRESEEILELFYIFPLIIHQWIFHYFQSKNRLYWTSPQHIYSVSIHQNTNRERVSPLIKMKQCYCPAVCYQSNINLPVDCIAHFPKHKHIMSHHHKYNAIFKCGGIANDRTLLRTCNATVLKPADIHKSEEELLTNLSLPLLPQRVASNCVVFSQTHGLLSIGGFVGTYNHWNSLPRRYVPNVYRLKFNAKRKQIMHEIPQAPISCTYFEESKTKIRYHFEPKWEWDNLTKMNESRGYSSAQMINKWNEERLVVLGGDLQIGDSYSNTAEIYSFERNEWKYLRNMKHGRICSGVHYDRNINCIYVGGGYCDSRIELYSNFRKVEVYNCIKNVWYPFPDTQLKHAFYPIMWKHNNLLFIASAYSTGLEYIDLRTAISWNTIYGEKNKKKRKFWHWFKKEHVNNAAETGAICSGRLVG